MSKKDKACMYRQGRDWIVVYPPDNRGLAYQSRARTYWEARRIVGEYNCPIHYGGKCLVQSHEHHLAHYTPDMNKET